MSRCFIFAIVLGLLFCWSPHAAAIDRTWDHETANDLWISAANWDPDGAPEFNDDVYIGAIGSTADDTVLLTSFGGQLTATVRNLRINRGTDLDTDGNILQVRQDTLVEGVIAGQTLSELIIRSAGDGVLALDTNTLTIAHDGRLRMSGSIISVDGTGDVDGVLEVREGGSIYGYGVINLDDDNLPDFTESMVSGGTITVLDPDALVIGEPPATTLQINSPNDPGGYIDLSGDSGASEININRNATLDLNVGTVGAPFVLRLLGNSTLELRDNDVLNIFDAHVQVNSGATDGAITLPAAPAVITGGSVILGDGGEISLNEADEVLIFESPFDSGIPIEIGSETISNAGTIRFAGNAQIRSTTTFNTFGTGRLVNEPGSQVRLFDGVDADTPITNNGDLTIGTTITSGQVRVDGFTQTSTGTLFIKIGDILPGDFDVLAVEGNAMLSGTLTAELIDGFEPILGNSFTILETVFGNISGEFDVEQVPIFNDLTFDVLYNPQSVVLQVVEALPGDYNEDGTVDAADYTVWRDNLGSTNALPNDDTSGVAADDYTRWKTNFGQTLGSSGAGTSFHLAPGESPEANHAVPEPSILVLISIGGLHAAAGAQRRLNCRRQPRPRQQPRRRRLKVSSSLQ